MRQPGIIKKFGLEILCVLSLILIATAMVLWGADSTLDSRFFYSAPEAMMFLTTLDPNKSKIYFHHELLDLCFIFTYSTLFILLTKRAYGTSPVKIMMALIPGLFDLMETGTILYFLNFHIYPGSPHWLGYMTAAKWLSTGIVSLWLIIGLCKRSFSK